MNLTQREFTFQETFSVPLWSSSMLKIPSVKITDLNIADTELRMDTTFVHHLVYTKILKQTRSLDY